jgi:hypothetical protein
MKSARNIKILAEAHGFGEQFFWLKKANSFSRCTIVLFSSTFWQRPVRTVGMEATSKDAS